MPSLPVRCRCGGVTGQLERADAASGLRLVCYCDDCQAFARFLERDEVLDARGGTDIFQTAPAYLALATGRDQVRCMRLSDKGMLRWYTGCCRTPIGNTLTSPGVPFVGIVHAFLDLGAAGRSLDDVVGPPRALLNGKFARGGVPPGAAETASVGFVLGAFARIVRARLAGKHRPTPFFDSAGAPVAPPRVLDPSERSRLAP